MKRGNQFNQFNGKSTPPTGGEKSKKFMTNTMESNHLKLQSKRFLGGAGNRTQIETEYCMRFNEERPQRHVLPLLQCDY
jgi:hypothetical protein